MITDGLDSSGRSNNRKLDPLFIYLGTSIGVGLFSAINIIANIIESKLLWVITNPPFFLLQPFLNLFGVEFPPSLLSGVILTCFFLLYYLILFWPVYQVFTVDRSLRPKRIKTAKILLGVFGVVHLSVACILMLLIRA